MKRIYKVKRLAIEASLALISAGWTIGQGIRDIAEGKSRRRVAGIGPGGLSPRLLRDIGFGES